MKQDVSSNEIVDDLKKKVLELYDVIDKASIYFEASVTCDDCIFFRSGACNTQHACFVFVNKQLKEKAGIE